MKTSCFFPEKFRSIPEKIPYKLSGKNSGQFLNKFNEPNSCNFLRRRTELLFAVNEKENTGN
jgi:hypothetical protein